MDPKSVSPACRVREFPNENLKVSASKLFVQHAGKKSLIVANHVASVNPLPTIR